MEFLNQPYLAIKGHCFSIATLCVFSFLPTFMVTLHLDSYFSRIKANPPLYLFPTILLVQEWKHMSLILFSLFKYQKFSTASWTGFKVLRRLKKGEILLDYVIPIFWQEVTGRFTYKRQHELKAEAGVITMQGLQWVVFLQDPTLPPASDAHLYPSKHSGENLGVILPSHTRSNPLGNPAGFLVLISPESDLISYLCC